MLKRQKLSVFINVACTISGLAQTFLSQLPWPLTGVIVPLIKERFATMKELSGTVKSGTKESLSFCHVIAV